MYSYYEDSSKTGSSLETGELSGENVQVYILNEQWAVLDKSITDSSGRTTFSLMPETYVIMVDNEKYLLAQEKLTLETNTMLEYRTEIHPFNA